MKALIISLILFAMVVPVKAQGGRSEIRQGNRHFKNEKFDQAELSYRKAQEEKKVNQVAGFNLGDALYRQKKFEDAGRQFEAAATTEMDKMSSARAYHNLGNSLLQAGKIDESINAYKDALRKNPTDLDTKYNLNYAMMMKKKQEQQKNDKNDKKDDKKDDQKEKNGENKDQQQQQNQPQDQKDQKADQQQANPQNMKISKEDAKRLLEALATDEKKVQEKVKKEKASATRVRTIKDW
jgi:tetratricopeptide (TPR) repeat protein